MSLEGGLHGIQISGSLDFMKSRLSEVLIVQKSNIRESGSPDSPSKLKFLGVLAFDRARKVSRMDRTHQKVSKSESEEASKKLKLA